MKRRTIDFTSGHKIEVLQSESTGKFWSQIVKFGGFNAVIWEQVENSETRAEALSKAEYALDSLTEAWLDEGEPEEPQEDDHKNGAPESQFLYKRP